MFNGIWLVARDPLTIKGREVAIGERFEISRVKAGPLLVLGQAVIAPREKPSAPEPETPKRKRGRPRKTQTPEAEKPTRQYRRRDLEAEP